MEFQGYNVNIDRHSIVSTQKRSLKLPSKVRTHVANTEERVDQGIDEISTSSSPPPFVHRGHSGNDPSAHRSVHHLEGQKKYLTCDEQYYTCSINNAKEEMSKCQLYPQITKNEGHG
jgi:hypothetical protein